MTNDGKARPLSVIIGERLRVFREERGLRQADIASAAAAAGLKWSRSSIASLEAGTRNLSVEELFLVPFVIMNAGGWDKPLVPSDAKVWAADGYHYQGDQLTVMANFLLNPLAAHEEARLAQGAVDLERDEIEELGKVQGYSETDEPLAHARRFAKTVMWGEYMAAQNPSLDFSLIGGDPMNPEFMAKVAERLSLPWVAPWAPDAWQYATYLPWVLWGRNAERERDARTEARGEYASKRSLQAARGHATRDIIAEINAQIEQRAAELDAYFRGLEAIWDDAEALSKWARDKTKEMSARARDVAASRIQDNVLQHRAGRRVEIAAQVLQNLKAIGPLLREARDRSGLTVEDVTRGSSLRAEHVRALEEGRVPGSWDTIVLRAGVRTLARRVGEDPIDMTAALEYGTDLLHKKSKGRRRRWRSGD